MTELAGRRCEACRPDTPALSTEQVEELLAQVPEWELRDGKLVRDLKVKNFRQALDYVNRIGAVAEDEAHHPDLAIHSWNRLRIELYTHSIGGLSTNDFIHAAKIDRLLGG